MSSGERHVVTGEAAISPVRNMIAESYCNVAAAVLVLYEHLITSDQDVTFVWNYQLTGTTALLFLNCFILIISCISNILASLNFFTECNTANYMQQTVNILLYILMACFSALRAYAITNRGWHWAMLVLLTGSVSAGAVIYNTITSPFLYVVYVDGVPICDYSMSISVTDSNHLVIATRVCSIFSDAVVIALTWSRTTPWKHLAPGAPSMSPLERIFSRDGAMYFLFLLVLNVLQITVGPIIMNNADLQIDQDYMSTFIPVISGILISRFMFSLRRPSIARRDVISSLTAITNTQISTMKFSARLIGSMDGPLDQGTSESNNEDITCNHDLEMTTIHRRDYDSLAQFGKNHTSGGI